MEESLELCEEHWWKYIPPIIYVYLLIALAMTLFVGFCLGQDNPRPGSTITTETSLKLREYERLTGPVPRPVSAPSKPDNKVVVVRENAAVMVPSTDVAVSYLTYESEGYTYYILIALQYPELIWVNHDEWSILGTSRIRALGPVGHSCFEFEIEPGHTN